jgi:Carboxypeptidase regulatory-like domain
MKVQQELTLPLFAVIIAASLAHDVLASCPTTTQGPPCQEYWRTETVFIGLATRVVRTPINTGLMIGPYVQSTVYFYIEQAFKGIEGTEVVLELNHCGYFFKEGERYLVYAHRNPNNNKLDVRAGNSRTRPLSEASDDLNYIRGLSLEASGSRVFGNLTVPTFALSRNKFAGDALQNIRIILEGNDQHQEVFTDSAGRYEFKGLPAGTYKLRAEVPSYLRFDEQTLKLIGRECVPLNIYAMRNAQIAGKVLNTSGQPVRGVAVSLISADGNPEQVLSSKAPSAMTYTDETGRYRFSQLAPGRYLIIINRTEPAMSDGMEVSRLIPHLFYPGVNDLRDATVIVLRRDSQPEEYIFHLPTPE